MVMVSRKRNSEASRAPLFLKKINMEQKISEWKNHMIHSSLKNEIFIFFITFLGFISDCRIMHRSIGHQWFRITSTFGRRRRQDWQFRVRKSQFEFHSLVIIQSIWQWIDLLGRIHNLPNGFWRNHPRQFRIGEFLFAVFIIYLVILLFILHIIM